MGTEWVLLGALVFVTPSLFAQPCPNLTANLYDDALAAVAIGFAEKSFLLQKLNGTEWKSLFLCEEINCRKLTSSTAAAAGLRDGRLELRRASAGSYRALGGLDSACLALIELREASRPLLSAAVSPRPLVPVGLAAFLSGGVLVFLVLSPLRLRVPGLEAGSRPPPPLRLEKRRKSAFLGSRRRRRDTASQTSCSLV